MSNKEFTITKEHNPLFREDIPVARFGTCEAHLMETENGEINIQYIQSDEEGQGDAQGLVRGLLNLCKEQGKTLSSSEPLSDDGAWAHICQKYGIKVYRMSV